MMYRQIIAISVIFLLHSNARISEKVDTSLFKCVQKVISHTFNTDTIQYVNLQGFISSQNPYLVFRDYVNNFQFQNIIVQLFDDVELPDIIKNVGFDKRVLIITWNATKFKYKKLFANAWFQSRTRVAVAWLSKESNILLTNTYVRSYNICPNMEYRTIHNVCTNSPDILTKTIDIKRYCHLRVSYVNVPPFVNNVKDPKGGLMVYSARVFGEIRGVTVDFLEDNSVYQTELIFNGTFHKLIKDLENGNQDIAIGQLFMNGSGEHSIEFGPVIYVEKLGFIHRKLYKISDYMKLIIVFDRSVWISITVTFLIVVPIYYFLNSLLENNISSPVVITDIFRLAIGSSIPVIPKSFPLRIVFTAFCMFGITINSTYLGKLSEIFTNPPSDLEEDIWDHGVRVHYSWLIERITCISYYAHLRPDTRQKKDAGNSIVNMTDLELLKLVRLIYIFL